MNYSVTGQGSFVKGYQSGSSRWTDNPTSTVAYYDAAPTSGPAGLWVWFTDMSIGGSSWSYSFGDNQSSSDRSPYHVFTNPAYYDVILNTTGCTTYDTFVSRLTVGTPPALVLAPTSLAFTTQSGGPSPGDQTFSVSNGGTIPFSYTVSDDAPWLFVSPGSAGAVPPARTETVSVNPSGLSPGLHEADITVTSTGTNGSPGTVHVALNISFATDAVSREVTLFSETPLPLIDDVCSRELTVFQSDLVAVMPTDAFSREFTVFQSDAIPVLPTDACSREFTIFQSSEAPPITDVCSREFTVRQSDAVTATALLQHKWSKRFGDGLEQRHGLVNADSHGNAFFCGDFKGTIDLGSGLLSSQGDWDSFLSKFDPSGNCLWSLAIGDPSSQVSLDATVDRQDNLIVIGDFQGTIAFGGTSLTSTGGYDIYMAKMSPAGEWLWARGFGGALDDMSATCTTDAEGNVILTGEFQETIDFGQGPLTSAGIHDAFLAKFGPDGNCLWSRSFGDNCIQYGLGVATDGQGNVLLSGLFSGTIDPGCGVLTANGPCPGTSNVYVAKYDPGGACLWARAFTGEEMGVATDPSGNVIVAGLFGRLDVNNSINLGCGTAVTAGSRDVFIARLDGGDGACIWSRTFGAPLWQSFNFYDLLVDARGTTYLPGWFEGTFNFGTGAMTSLGGEDAYVAAFDSTGACQWSAAFGSSGDQRIAGLALAGNDLILGGYFTNELDLGGGPLVSAGDWDVFLSRFAILATGAGVGDGPAIAIGSGVLQSLSPNPASSWVRLAFALPGNAPVNIAVYDVRGRLVRQLTDAGFQAGNHEVVWDGRDGQGMATPSGVYFCRLTADGRSEVRKVMLLR